MRALPFEVIDDLIASGNLDPAIRTKIPTLEVAKSTWLKSTAGKPPAINTNCNPF